MKMLLKRYRRSETIKSILIYTLKSIYIFNDNKFIFEPHDDRVWNLSYESLSVLNIQSSRIMN